MELNELEIAQLDVESVLEFAQHVLHNASRLWTEAFLDQKQRLQKVLFPEGLSFSEGKLGTPKTSLAFNILDAENFEKEKVASPTGFEPVLPA